MSKFFVKSNQINNDEIKINLCKKYEIDYFYLNKLYNTIGASNKNKFKNDLGIYVDYDKIRNEIKKDINKIATTSSIKIEIKHFIIDIYPKSVRGN